MADDSVLYALGEQCDCYRQLAKLARTQHEYIQDCRTEDLLLVLSKRQGLLDRISQFEKTVAPAKRQWAQFLSELPAVDWEKAQAMLDETRKLLEEITTSDREDSIVLQQRKFSLGKEINQAAIARKINKNYAAAAYGPKKSALDLQR
jgi:hypothetical protein